MTANVKLQWMPEALAKSLTQGAILGVREAGEFLVEEIRNLIGIQGVPIARRSLPGEPPRLETGDLQRSIDSLVGDRGPLWRKIGSLSPPMSYAIDLEYGITVDQRPYLRTSLARWGKYLGEIILSRMQHGG